MQARYYDPVVGRFMGIDPVGVVLGNQVSFNRYAYGGNNPYKFVDPDGTYPESFEAGFDVLAGGLQFGAGVGTFLGGIMSAAFGVGLLAAPEPTTVSKFVGVAAIAASPAVMLNGQVLAREGLNNIFNGWDNRNPHSLDEPTVGDVIEGQIENKTVGVGVGVGFVVDTLLGRFKVRNPHVDYLDKIDTANDIVEPAHDVMGKKRSNEDDESDLVE